MFLLLSSSDDIAHRMRIFCILVHENVIAAPSNLGTALLSGIEVLSFETNGEV